MAKIRNQKFTPQIIIARWTATSSLTSHLTGCPPISSLFYSTIFLTSGDLCEMDRMMGWTVMDRSMLIACFSRLRTLWMLNSLCGGQTLRWLHDSHFLAFIFLYNLLLLNMDGTCDFFLTSRMWNIIHTITLCYIYTVMLVDLFLLSYWPKEAGCYVVNCHGEGHMPGGWRVENGL